MHSYRVPVRKTRRRYEVPGHARYLTCSTDQRQPILDDHASTIVADQLMLTRTRLNFRLFAWVIMPEHIHLLVMPNPPELEVPRILSAIKRPTSTRIRRHQRALGHNLPDRFWQAGGGYDRNIFSQDELHEKITYIHNNPVRRGLVDRPTKWPWSSASAYDGLESRWPDIDRI